MSKEGSEAHDLQMAQAANEQENELVESGLRALKPVEGSPEAQAVAGEREAVSDVMKLPLFEEAVAAIEAVNKGDNKALDQLSHAYGNKNVKFIKRIPEAPNGGKGWHPVAREDGPLTLEQSRLLSDIIYEKIDVDKMNADAEKSGAARNRRKARKEKGQKEPKEENGSKAEINSFEQEKLREIVENAQDLKALTDFAHDAKREGLIKLSGGRKWKAEAIRELKGSHELAQAINSKQKKLLKEMYRKRGLESRKQEQLKRKLAGIKGAINEKEDLLGLEKLSYQFLGGKIGIVKKVNLPGRDWTVEAIEGKEGSEEVVKMVLERKAVLEIRDKTAKLIQKHS